MKKRSLCIATICYIIGIVVGLYLKMSIVFLLCIFVLIEIFTKSVINKNILIFLLLILIGFYSIKNIDNRYIKQYQSLQSKDKYKVEGVIVSEPVEKEYKIVYEIEIKSINGNSKYKGNRWLLEVKKKSHINLQFGNVVSFSGTIEIPSNARNTMGFDYQQYLKTQKIYGTMIANDAIRILDDNDINFFYKVWHFVRVSIKEKVYILLPKGARELCLGVLIGDKKEMSEEMIDSFNKSNLTHMLAVSGAHVSYMISILSILLCKTGYRFCKISMIIFLLFFMGLTRFTPSVQRASFMAIITLLGGLLYRKSDVHIGLAFSCFIILWNNPYSILNIGFQLSYGGTMGIIFFQKKISKLLCQRMYLNNDDNIRKDEGKVKDEKKVWKKIQKYIIETIVVTISANLIILPIMAFHFHTISLSFWISNLLAGPLLGLITILGFISYIVSVLMMPISEMIAVPLKYMVYALILIAKTCSKLPLSSMIVRTPFVFEIIFYYLSLFIFYQFTYFKKKLLKIMSVFMILLITCYSIIGILKFHKLHIYFIDVGQGDCTLICTPSRKTILIDGGGSENQKFGVGEKTVLPYLLNRKIKKIDYIMISHFDTDHVRFYPIFVTKDKSKKCNYWKAI